MQQTAVLSSRTSVVLGTHSEPIQVLSHCLPSAVTVAHCCAVKTTPGALVADSPIIRKKGRVVHHTTQLCQVRQAGVLANPSANTIGFSYAASQD